MTFIERVQVDAEGFLAGLDVRFERGLNVVIGSRGTGKTSLIELIRYCLEAAAFTDEAGIRGQQQAVATLDGGSVTVTLRDGSDRLEITRDSEGTVTKTIEAGGATVIAQSEMEAIGASPAGRLRLVDRFLPKSVSSHEGRLRHLRATVRSLTLDASVAQAEARQLADEVLELASVDSELASARAAQETILNGSNATAADQDRLRALQLLSSRVAETSSRVADFVQTIETARASATSAENRLRSYLGNLPQEGVLNDAQRAAEAALAKLQDAISGLSESAEQANAAAGQVDASRAAVEKESRELRQRLESVQEGVSQVSRVVTALETKRGQLTAVQSRLEESQRKYQELRSARDLAFDELESMRVERLEARMIVADNLNRILGPAVRVEVFGSQRTDPYEAAIVSGLRGSGVHYNTLAPLISANVSPRELVDWVESADASALSSAIGIVPDRANAVLTALRGEAAAEIIAVEIEDGVDIELLDGPGYKSASDLSIGQRCTAIMPVLLAMHGDPLIIDQPEDHLDNAFIVSTLIAALGRRDEDDQLIFSSHNANIPVLGNAQRIIVLASDGKHGRVAHAGSLTDPASVESITSIMEGGEEAFEIRASFYASGAT